MSLLCKLFGHPKPKVGWWGDALYGRVRGGYADGTGRTHFRVEKPCERCDEIVVLARFHGSDIQPLLDEARCDGLRHGIDAARHARKLLED